ncbi:MAG: lipid II flippase MurJ, partial [Myxococcota bacterium]
VLVGSIVGPFVVPLLDLARTRTVRLRVRVALDPDFKKYLWIALPLMVGLSLATVDEWYERWFGATLAVGTVAHLSFARKLMMAPVAVVGQAVAAAALPSLARLFAAGQREALNRTLLQTLRVSLVLAVLSGTACVVLAGPLVEFVYRHGRFGEQDALAVASILFVLAFAVPAWVTQQIAVRAFYARGDTWRPMILATVVALAAIPLYLALTRSHGAPGIALAGVLAMTANAVATLVWGARRFDGPALGPLFGSGARALGIGLVAGLAAGFAQPRIAPGWEGAFLDLAVGGSVFLGVSGIGCWWWGDDAMRRGLAAIGAHLWRWPQRRTLQ